jgi:hypothetical protein
MEGILFVSRKKTVGVFFGSSTMVGSYIKEGNWTSNPIKIHIVIEAINFVGVNLAFFFFSCWLMEKGSVTNIFFYFYFTIYAWDVENTWLTHLIWIFGCKQMKSIWILNIRRHRKHFSLKTNETCHGGSGNHVNMWNAIEHCCME